MVSDVLSTGVHIGGVSAHHGGVGPPQPPSIPPVVFQLSNSLFIPRLSHIFFSLCEIQTEQLTNSNTALEMGMGGV